MKNTDKETSALVWKEGGLYVAKSLDIEVTSQGKTKKEALMNLKEALELYLEKDIPTTQFSPYMNLSVEKFTISYA